MSAIVVIEQSERLRDAIARALRNAGYVVQALKDGSGLSELCLARGGIGLFLIGGVCTRTLASLDVIKKIKERSQAPVVVLPGESSEDLAIAALRLQVQDYLPPPVEPSDVVAIAQRLLGCDAHPEAIVGTAKPVTKIKWVLPRIASKDCNVLITGETGTGKELIAEQIHVLGPRREKPFVAVNCAAIPDTLLESELFGYERGAFTGASRRTDGLLHGADGGTLFLDEIGDMSLLAQSKILRAIETGTVRRIGTHVANSVNVRVIAATNQNLDAMIQDGRFRPDLYFRLNIARVELPPLRERPEDIPALVRHFLDESAPGTTVSCEVASLFAAYSWPGNIRELRNVIQGALVYASGPVLRLEDLPEFFVRKATNTERPVKELNRLLAALEQTQWNKSRAAESLHWSRMTLYRKMMKHGVSPRPNASAATRVHKAGA